MSNLPHLFQQGMSFFPSYYSIIFIAIILPFLLSLFCAAAISRIGHRLALIDNPNIRSSHSLPTPRGGGIGIWLHPILEVTFINPDYYFCINSMVIFDDAAFNDYSITFCLLDYFYYRNGKYV